ncbi:aspartate/glutamate racemase family protein [Rathayibacter soli]|uniref:aspartate/glutamate racemase family protein n=1 Tax=Rathayibacter soli TaxID=3144168 RepID=UPI0027E3BD44|nr:aspartate/glutamate racemase family protein [Glaciibacter superstes]
MAEVSRIALVHTGAVVIPMTARFIERELPRVTAVNYLDDRIVADLADERAALSVPARVRELAQAAVDGGAAAILLTCSSISELAAQTADAVGVPVLRIDEAMADEAIGIGQRITVIATLPTTCGPTARLIAERAARAGRSPLISSVVVEGAFDAVASGDRAAHDALVACAIRDAVADADVIVLAQASMASAVDAVEVAVPVLTSIESGVKRLRGLVESLPPQ